MPKDKPTTPAPAARSRRRLLEWAALLCVAAALASALIASARSASEQALRAETTHLAQLADLLAGHLDTQFDAAAQAMQAAGDAPAAPQLALLARAMPFLDSLVLLAPDGRLLAAAGAAPAPAALRGYLDAAAASTRASGLSLVAAGPGPDGAALVLTRSVAGDDGQARAVLAARLNMATLRAALNAARYASDVQVSLRQDGRNWIALPDAAPAPPLLAQRRVLRAAGPQGERPLVLELSRPEAAVSAPLLRTEGALMVLFSLLLLLACAALRARHRPPPAQADASAPAAAHVAGALAPLLDHLDEGVFLFDAQWRLLHANRAARTWHGLVADGAQSPFDAGLALALADGSALAPADWPWRPPGPAAPVRDLLLRLTCLASGASRLCQVSIAPLQHSGSAVRWAMTCRDVTEQRRARDVLDSEARFRTLIEEAPLPIAILRQGHFLYTNPRYRALHGYTASDDLSGLPWRAMLSPASNAALWAQEALIMADSAIEQKFEAIGLGKDGHPVPVYKTTARVQLSDGAATMVFAQDISAQKSAEAAMLLARDAAQAASRSKADFLANMSHEIRSPLNAMIGLAYLLEQSHLPADAQGMVRRMRASGRSLLGIINDVLDMSKIEAGHMPIEHAPFALDDVIARVADSMASAVGDKPIELLIAPMPAPGLVSMGDAMRLEQVLVNLTGNAIKFTAAGTVALDCELTGAQAGPRLILRVRDTGIGIAAEDQDAMFSAFTQADGSTTRRFGGTGLGLTICRQLVGLMGGSIEVESAPGQGSTFQVSLPWEAGPPAPAPAAAPCTLFIAAPASASADTAAALARQLGWQAVAGVPNTAALARGDDHAVLLLDWALADAEALATIAALRAAANASWPVVLMASMVQLAGHADRQAIDAFLTKPVTAVTLRRAVDEARVRRASAAGLPAAEQAQAEQRLQGLHVLVVDDSDINRNVVAMILGACGAQTSFAADGGAALAWLDAHPDLADLVLMDVQMPGMDGLEATRQLRRQARFATLPVIALSAGAFVSQREAALEAGMDHFVSKPFEAAPLIALIERVWHGERAPAAAPSAPASLPTIMPDLDLEQGQAIWSDLVLYRGYLGWFCTEYRDAADAIGASLAQGDRDGARRLAHKVAGVAGNLALRASMAAALQLEQVLAGDQAGADDQAALAHFGASLEQALAAIARFDSAPAAAPHGAGIIS